MPHYLEPVLCDLEGCEEVVPPERLHNGAKFHSDECRKKAARRRYNRGESGGAIPPLTLGQRVEKEKERLHSQELKRTLQELTRSEAKRQEYTSAIKSVLEPFQPSEIFPLIDKKPETVVEWALELCDWHVGQYTTLEMTGQVYEQTVEKTREQVDRLIQAVSSIFHESEGKHVKRLWVPVLGDIVEGDSMRPAQLREIQIPVVKQTIESFDLLVYLLRSLLQLPGLEELKVDFVGGNHDRLTTKAGNAGLGETDFCVGVGTKILTDELLWAPIESLRVGDGIVGFEETTSSTARHYEHTGVTSTRTETRPVYEITLETGEVLTSTPEHRWLMNTSVAGMERTLRWIRTDELPQLLKDVRRQYPLCLPRIMPKAEPQGSHETGFLGAAFDGEGWVRGATGRGATIGFGQNPNLMLSRTENYLHNTGFRFSRRERKDGLVTLNILGGQQEQLRFLMEVQPTFLIEKLVTRSLSRMKVIQHQRVPIKKVQFVGEKPVVVMSTSTGTYIAEGFGAHNCDTFSWLIGEMTKRAFGDDPRVEVVNWETFYGTREFAGRRHVFEHGASIRSSGGYGGVPYYPIVNAARQYESMLGGVDCVWLGHLHIPYHLPLGQEGHIIGGGSLPASSRFILSRYKTLHRPQQWLVEFHRNWGPTAFRPLYVDVDLPKPREVWDKKHE